MEVSINDFPKSSSLVHELRRIDTEKNRNNIFSYDYYFMFLPYETYHELILIACVIKLLVMDVSYDCNFNNYRGFACNPIATA